MLDIAIRKHLKFNKESSRLKAHKQHRKVNQALEQQMKQLWHTTSIYMHPKIYEYAERLASKLPGDLNVVYFTNSGSEANDLAMLLARLYTQNYEILTLKNSYHGASTSTMGLTGLQCLCVRLLKLFDINF